MATYRLIHVVRDGSGDTTGLAEYTNSDTVLMPVHSSDPSGSAEGEMIYNSTANTIKIYDTTTLFNAGSTKANGRYMYHAMDATIGDTTNSMWLFAGTGDYERINDTTSGVQNFMLGIKDQNYPFFKDVAVPAKADTITK